MKRCAGECAEVKPESDFPFIGNARGVNAARQSRCRDCGLKLRNAMSNRARIMCTVCKKAKLRKYFGFLQNDREHGLDHKCLKCRTEGSRSERPRGPGCKCHTPSLGHQWSAGNWPLECVSCGVDFMLHQVEKHVCAW